MKSKTKLPVAVVDEESASRPGERIHVLRRFATIAEAEAWVGERPDKAKLVRGGYGIDAPEAMINPRASGPSCPWPMQMGDDGPIVDLISVWTPKPTKAEKAKAAEAAKNSAIRQKQRSVALSLFQYVEADDAKLTREMFLLRVIDRIESDLRAWKSALKWPDITKLL